MALGRRIQRAVESQLSPLTTSLESFQNKSGRSHSKTRCYHRRRTEQKRARAAPKAIFTLAAGHAPRRHRGETIEAICQNPLFPCFTFNLRQRTFLLPSPDGQTDTPRIHLDRHDFTMTEKIPNKISISGTLRSRLTVSRTVGEDRPRDWLTEVFAPLFPSALFFRYRVAQVRFIAHEVNRRRQNALNGKK